MQDYCQETLVKNVLRQFLVVLSVLLLTSCGGADVQMGTVSSSKDSITPTAPAHQGLYAQGGSIRQARLAGVPSPRHIYVGIMGATTEIASFALPLRNPEYPTATTQTITGVGDMAREGGGFFAALPGSQRVFHYTMPVQYQQQPDEVLITTFNPVSVAANSAYLFVATLPP